MKKQRIGILGGTFNPPHLGHLVLAKASLRKLKLDKIIFMPAYLPPHKKIKNNNARMRYKMVALACKDYPRFEVSDLEINKGSVSYSVETLRLLSDKYGKGAKLFFITGSDSLGELEKWKDVREILKLARFVVAKRPGFPIAHYRKKIRIIDVDAPDIASSMVRARVKRGISIAHLVPRPVENFIIRHKLYT